MMLLTLVGANSDDICPRPGLLAGFTVAVLGSWIAIRDGVTSLSSLHFQCHFTGWIAVLRKYSHAAKTLGQAGTAWYREGTLQREGVPLVGKEWWDFSGSHPTGVCVCWHQPPPSLPCWTWEPPRQPAQASELCSAPADPHCCSLDREALLRTLTALAASVDPLQYLPRTTQLYPNGLS
ncbi:hypothetical protein CB1_001441003 [Camelus ferus]|nr:hypothetical protein CB1_001441003 [Camelus ferus]